MTTQYRILEKGGRFYPQYKRGLWPFWRTFQRDDVYFDDIDASYRSLQKADDALRKYLDCAPQIEQVHPFNP